MGVIASTINSIDGKILLPWPTKPVTLKVVRCGRAIVGMTALGTCYTNVAEKRICYDPSAPWTDDVVNCLAALGAITSAQRDEHLSYVKARRQESERAYALYETLKNHHHGFIKLTRPEVARMWKQLQASTERTDLPKRLLAAGFKP